MKGSLKMTHSALWGRVALALSFGFVVQCALATNYTWCGDGGDGEWTNPANWLKDGTTVVEAGYPGISGTGAASTGDNATFLADTEATVKLGDTLQINQLDLSKGGVKLTLVGGTAGTNNLLTIGNDLKVNATGNELTLDNFGIMRNGAVTLGANMKLSLVNAAFFRQNGITMNAGSSVSLAGGSQMYVNGAITPVANGNNQLSLAGGSTMTVVNASTLTAGFELSLADASFVNFKNKLTAYLAKSISLADKSRLIVDNELDFMNDGQTVLLDDSTLETKYYCYLVNAAPGGGTFTFQGANPRFICRSLIRIGYNNAAVAKPIVFNYVVPEGGFAEVPFQNLQKDFTSFGDNWNMKAFAKFAVNPASPALSAGTTTEQALFLSVKGMVGVSKYNYLDLTDATAAMRVTDGTPDGTAAVVKDNYATQHAVFATIGSGAAATRATSVSKVATDPLSITVNRRTLTVLAPVVGVSSSAAKSRVQLLVSESGSALEPVVAQEIASPGIYTLSWTAPEGNLEKNYQLAVRVVGLNASGAEVDSDTTATFATRTLDATTYYWTGKGGDGLWANPANWRTDFGDDMLGYPQVASATAEFPTDTKATIVIDRELNGGKFYATQRTGVDLRFVNAAATTNENKITFSSFECNGTGGQIVFDGLAVNAPGMTVGQGRRLIFTNGSDLWCTGAPGFSRFGQLIIEKKSTASFNGITLQDSFENDDAVMVIDDAYVASRNNVLLPNNNWASALVFRGKNPVLRMTGNALHFRVNQASKKGVIRFEIPEGGYDAAPIQGTGAMTVKFGNNGTAAGAGPLPLEVVAESPVFFSDADFTQPLVAWATAGINPAMVAATCANPAGTFAYDEGEQTLSLVIQATAKADTIKVTGYPEEVPAAGAAYGEVTGLGEGEQREFSAPSGIVSVSETKRATCLGWKLYAVDRASNVRTLVDEGAGNACAYTHSGEYRELVWQWKVENLVSASAGSGGTVSAPVWCASGDTATIVATADSGYVFREWTGLPANGLEFARTAQVSAADATEVVATFDRALYAAPDADGSGDGSFDAPYTLAQAIAAADGSSTVVLKTGEYPQAATLTLAKAVRITSATGNPADAVICAAKDAKGNPLEFNPIVKATVAGTRLCDLTILGVKASPGCLWLENGTAANLVLTGCIKGNGANGGAAYLKTGRITRSLIANNSYVNTIVGGGVKMEGDAALVEYCTITNNITDGYGDGGAGVYMTAGRLSHCVVTHNQSRAPLGHGAYGAVRLNGKGTIEYCLVADNFGGDSGGGLHISNTAGSIVDHCTVVGNCACSSAGGVVWGGINAQMHNCIVWGNRIALELNSSLEQLGSVPDNWILNTDNCLPRNWGQNTLVADPLFVDPENGDYRLRPDSPCVALGYGYAPYDGIALKVCLDAFEGRTFRAGRLSFTAVTDGGRGKKALNWKVDDLLQGVEGIWTAGEETLEQVFAAGHYRLTVRATDETGAAASCTRTFYAGVTDTVYVIPEGTEGNVPAAPYTSEATAANDVNEAIHYCAEGGELVVSDGLYGVTHELCVPRKVTVRSVNGPEKTWLYRIGAYKSGDSFRIAHLANPEAVLSGFCISNGYWSTVKQELGAGVLNQGGTVSNCWFVKCWGQVGQYSPTILANMNGRISNCRIWDCEGGGAFGGGVCQFGANSVARDLEVSGFRTPAGYSYGSGQGMHLMGGLAERIYVHDNYNAYGYGGGTCSGIRIRDAELRDSLVVRCQAGANGGGGMQVQANAVIVNCTIANCDAGQNTTTGQGGGMLIDNAVKATIVNTVFAGNTVTRTEPLGADPDWYAADGAPNVTFVNCAFSSERSARGEGAVVTDNPRFTDMAAGDYTLAIGSPLVDKGTLWNRTEDETDFGGNSRVQGASVDIGCYEQEVSDDLNCTVDVSGYETAEGAVTIVVTPVGEAQGVEVKVVAVAADGTETTSDWGDALTRQMTLPVGVYTFKAYIRDDKGREGSAEAEGGAKVVRAKTVYLVDEAHMTGEPAFPYGSWATAATNILDLVALCGNGTEMIVGPGVHVFTAGAVFDVAVTIRSAEGPTRTTLRRAGKDQNNGDAMRMVQLQTAGSVISGFTFANGRGEDLSYGAYVSANASTITNCVFGNANLNYMYAGGVYNYNGTCVDCVFTNFVNLGTGYGGFYMQEGASAVGERLYVCNNKPARNYYNYGAVTLAGGVLRNCVITNNIFESQSNGNRAGGVEMRGGRLESCLVAFNTAGTGAGGVRVLGDASKGCEIVNCTIVSNSCSGTEISEPRGGGIAVQNNSFVRIVNSIVWGNRYLSSNPRAEEGDLKDEIGTWGINNGQPQVGTYELVTSHVGGADPKFRNWNRGNFHIKTASPCYNAGTVWEGVEDAVDLDGRPRWQWSRPDLGCFECVSGGGMLIRIR